MNTEIKKLLVLAESGDSEAMKQLKFKTDHGLHGIQCYTETTPTCVCGLYEAQDFVEMNKK